jgi:hypothetical protein
VDRTALGALLLRVFAVPWRKARNHLGMTHESASLLGAVHEPVPALATAQVACSKQHAILSKSNQRAHKAHA